MAASNCSMPLNCFQNLTSLELMDFYSFLHMPLFASNLASLLSRSPRLKRLGLGKACRHEVQWPDALIVEDHYYFLEELCTLFESMGCEPLSLETLRLGQGMYLFQRSVPDETNGFRKHAFLSKLVKLAELKTLHVFNGLVKMGSEDNEEEFLSIDWTLSTLR